MQNQQENISIVPSEILKSVLSPPLPHEVVHEVSEPILPIAELALEKTVEVQSSEPEPGNIEKQKVMDSLKEIGVLVSFSDVETFHGYIKRVLETDEWDVMTAEQYKKKVLADARNAGRDSWLLDKYVERVDSGNNNAYNTFCLYAASEPDAKRFAGVRLVEKSWNARQKLLGDLVRETDAGQYFQSVRDRQNTLSSESKWGDQEVDFSPVLSEWPDDNDGYEISQAIREYEKTLEEQQLVELQEEAIRLSGNEAVVVEIAALSTEATLFDFREPKQGRPENAQQSSEILEGVTPEYTHYLDSEIQKTNNAKLVQVTLKELNSEFATENTVQMIVTDFGIPESEVRMFTEAYNARKMFIENAGVAIYNMLVIKGSHFTPKALREEDVRCSKDFVLSTLKELGIVGVINNLKSYTTGDVIHDTVTIFDLEAVKRK